MKGKLLKVVLFVLVLSVLVSACAPAAAPTPQVVEKEKEVTKIVEKVVTATPPPAPKPIKIGLPVILTGADTYVFGELVRDAAILAVEEINAAGPRNRRCHRPYFQWHYHPHAAHLQ